MEHQTLVVAIREQSERFIEVLAGVDAAAPVPSCPGWSVADLLWHVAEVQHFWAQVAGGADTDDVVPLDHPGDVAALRTLVARAGTELLGALGQRSPSDASWSWHPAGGSIAWLARRQAHEALIHRVDAELAAGVDVRPPSAELALDGVDEVLTVQLEGHDGQGTFVPEGARVLLSSSNLPGWWELALGRRTGDGEPGSAGDRDAVRVSRLAGAAAGPVDAQVTGHAWELDLWLWGRADASGLEVTGDAGLVERIRAVAAESTR